MSKIRKLTNIAAAPLLILLAVAIAGKLVSSRKAPPVRKKAVAVAKVTTLSASPETVQPQIHTFGNTRSYLTSTVSSQVSGEILRIAPEFETGLSVPKGHLLVEVNPADYEAALAEKRSSLSAAEETLAEEETRARLAEEDWLASGRELSDASDFTLRKPQLATAKAAVVAAKALVAKAALDVSRARIVAPFDALVESRTASPGNIVTAGSKLGSLLAREQIEARLPLTPEQVERFGLARIATAPPIAKLTTETLPGVVWDAKISRVEPSIDVRNQTLWVIAEIEDPFSDPESSLPVGSFVNATIDGEPLDDIVRFPEVAVVEDAFVWAVSPDNTLQKQPIEIIYSQGGEILSRIAEPVFGYPLKIVSRPLASFRAGQRVEPTES